MSKQWNALSQGGKIVAGVGCGAVILICCSTLAVVAAMSNTGNTPSTGAAQSTSTLSASHTPALPTATPKPKAWVTVKHLAGSGNSQSDTFDIKTGDHILTSCTASSDANLLIADLYLKGESYGNDLPYAELVDRDNSPCTKDTYTIQQDSATVYLRVEADSIQWTVDVQRYE